MSSLARLGVDAGCRLGLQRPHLWLPHVTCASLHHGHLGAVSPFVAQAFKGKYLRTKRKLGSLSRPSLGGYVGSLRPHAAHPWESQACSELRQHRGEILDSTLCSKESGSTSFSLRLPEPRKELSFWGASLDLSACQGSRPFPPSFIQGAFSESHHTACAARFGRTFCSHGVKILARESRQETSE